jgi:LPS export ABC transporter protein LptC
MSVTKQGFFSSFILFGGVLFSSWLAIKSTVLEEPIQDKNQIVGVGYDLKDWQMSNSGGLQSITTAKKMFHYADGRSRFFSVSGRYFDFSHPDLPPWNLSSDMALVSSDSRYVYLTDHVRLWRDKTTQSSSLEATTTRLNYDRIENLIYTDVFVTLKEPDVGNLTTGLGLTVDINHNEIKLLKDVHTLYMPTQSEGAS